MCMHLKSTNQPTNQPNDRTMATEPIEWMNAFNSENEKVKICHELLGHG